MKRAILASIFLVSGAAASVAQEAHRDDLWRLPFLPPPESPPPPDAIPVEPLPQAVEGMGLTLGARAGYLRVPDADRGTWHGGIQGRLGIVPPIAVEGSIEFHQADFFRNDVTVTQYPIQLTGLVFLPLDFKIEPYGLAGVGWYYTRTTYSGNLRSLNPTLPSSETDNVTGVHVGAGAALKTGGPISLSADFRWVFIDEPGVDNSALADEEWDFWMFTAAASFPF